VCVLFLPLLFFFSSLSNTYTHTYTLAYPLHLHISRDRQNLTLGQINFTLAFQYTHIHTLSERLVMVKRDGAAIRRERMEEIARTIQRNLHNHGEIPLRQNVALFAYKLGLTKPKVTEYLRILEELGQFVLDFEGDKIRKVSENVEA